MKKTSTRSTQPPDTNFVQIYWMNTLTEQREFIKQVEYNGLNDLSNWCSTNWDMINDKKMDANYVLIFATKYSKYYNKKLEK